jgi:hypothetical protein
MQNQEPFVTVDQLDASGRRAVMIGFLWRGLVLNVLVAAIGGIVGFAIGFVLSLGLRLFHVAPHPAHQTVAILLAGVGGFVIGLYGLWQYIRWLFRVQFGGYRLRLVPAGADHSSDKSTSAL